MQNSYFLRALSGILMVGAVTSTDATTMRIPIVDEKPLQMYALGAMETRGLYKINLTDVENPVRINPESLTYDNSRSGGSGVFLSAEQVVGIRAPYGGFYAFEATAEGNGTDGPWSASYNQIIKDVYNVNGMTYDEQENKIFVSYKNSDSLFASASLGVYDADTHTVSMVGAFGAAVTALAVDTEGTLWGIGSYGAMYTVDKGTGKATKKGDCNVQFNTSSVCASASVDPASGYMYVLARANGGSTMSLTKVDLSTLTGEILGTLPGNYNCFTIIGTTVSEGAPAQVENLSATFNGETTVVTFTAPTLTKGGKPLTGTLTYTITVDSEEAATGDVTPGAEVAVNVDMPDGPHSIGVSVSNSEGTGKATNTTVFAGYDLPAAITGLKADANGESVTLTWTVPVGANGGEVNTAKLSYTVSRNDEVIATGLTETSFTEILTEEYLEYNYTVTVVYGEEDVNSTSIPVYAGKAWSAPYTIDLNAGSLGLAGIQAVDPNTGNTVVSPTWVISANNGENTLYSYSGYYQARSEFAYLPLTALKAGVDYILTFEAAAYVDNEYMLNHYEDGSSQANLDILLATSANGNASEATLLKQVTVMPKIKEFAYETQTVSFSVDTDGDYFIAIEEEAKSMSVYHSFRVKDIALTYEGYTGVDCALTDNTSVAVSVADRAVRITGAEGLQVVICTVDGKVIANTVATADYTTAALARGVYVVNVAGKAVKVVL